MSTKPETTYTNRLRKKLLRAAPQIDVYKTNNPFVGGMADLYVDGPGGDAWIEMKWADKLTKQIDLFDLSKKPHLSLLQQRFLKRRFENGRRTAVIVGGPEGGIVFVGSRFHVESTILNDDEILQVIIKMCGVAKNA